MDHQYSTLAIDLNNHGALQLQQGDVASALETFSRAANLLVLMSSTRQYSDFMVVQGSTSSATMMAATHWHWLDCSTSTQNWCQDEEPSKEGSTPFLFMRAIVIAHYSLTSPESSLSVPILFNVALCCSILGTRLGERLGPGFLEVAHDMYQKVSGLMEELMSPDASLSTPATPIAAMLLLLSMAVANNRACIYYTIKSMPQATLECLNQLAMMLEWSTPMGIKAQDRGDLMLNLQILITSQTVAAAA